MQALSIISASLRASDDQMHYGQQLLLRSINEPRKMNYGIKPRSERITWHILCSEYVLAISNMMHASLPAFSFCDNQSHAMSTLKRTQVVREYGSLGCPHAAPTYAVLVGLNSFIKTRGRTLACHLACTLVNPRAGYTGIWLAKNPLPRRWLFAAKHNTQDECARARKKQRLATTRRTGVGATGADGYGVSPNVAG